MKPSRLSVIPLRLPDFLEKKCQALLDDIQGAHSVNVALLSEQHAAGFTEALAWLQVMPPAQTEGLYRLYGQALRGRIAALGH